MTPTSQILCLFVTFTASALGFEGSTRPQYHLQKRLSAPYSDTLVELEADTRVTSNTDYESIPKDALNAKVQVILASGKTLSSLTLETPRADIEWLEGTPKGTHLLFITENKTVNFGSYNGPISVLYSLDQGKLVPVTTENSETKKKNPISFMRSLKENWRVEKNGSKKYPEIYSVSCRPVPDPKGKDVNFKTTYSRYFFDGKNWQEKRRTENGLWEDEGSFPLKELFP